MAVQDIRNRPVPVPPAVEPETTVLRSHLPNTCRRRFRPRRPVALIGCLLGSYTLLGAGVARGDTAELCEQNAAALRQLVTSDDLVEAFRDTAAAAVKGAIEAFGGVKNDDRDALLDAARNFDFDSNQLAAIAKPLIKVAKSAVLTAVAEEMTDFSVQTAQKKLDGVLRRTQAYKLPKEPLLSSLANPTTCEGGRAFLAEIREYSERWRAWQASLRDVAALPEYPPCRGLDSEEYRTLATAFGRLVDPMIQLGLALDTIRGSGTVQTTAYFTGFSDLGTTASQIADKVDGLSLNARRALKAGEQRFANLSANSENVLVPAVDEKCRAEIEQRLKEIAEESIRRRKQAEAEATRRKEAEARAQRQRAAEEARRIPPGWIRCHCPNQHTAGKVVDGVRWHADEGPNCP